MLTSLLLHPNINVAHTVQTDSGVIPASCSIDTTSSKLRISNAGGEVDSSRRTAVLAPCITLLLLRIWFPFLYQLTHEFLNDLDVSGGVKRRQDNFVVMTGPDGRHCERFEGAVKNPPRQNL
jgi:hypothetical protein